MPDLWPIPPNTPESAEAIARVKDLVSPRKRDAADPPPRKPKPIKVSTRCEYRRDGRRCGQFGTMTHGGEYRCSTHAFLERGI